MSWSPEECRDQGEPQGDRYSLCARLVKQPDRGSQEHLETGLGPISIRTASGPALAFWQAVLVGDVCSVSRILSDSSTGLAPDSVFDTSDPERWRDYRFNIRALSTGWGMEGSEWERGGLQTEFWVPSFRLCGRHPLDWQLFTTPWALRPLPLSP